MILLDPHVAASIATQPAEERFTASLCEAKIRDGRISIPDVPIARTARAYGAVLAAWNRPGFPGYGLTVIDPCQPT